MQETPHGALSTWLDLVRSLIRSLRLFLNHLVFLVIWSFFHVAQNLQNWIELHNNFETPMWSSKWLSRLQKIWFLILVNELLTHAIELDQLRKWINNGWIWCQKWRRFFVEVQMPDTSPHNNGKFGLAARLRQPAETYQRVGFCKM